MSGLGRILGTGQATDDETGRLEGGRDFDPAALPGGVDPERGAVGDVAGRGFGRPVLGGEAEEDEAEPDRGPGA